MTYARRFMQHGPIQGWRPPEPVDPSGAAGPLGPGPGHRRRHSTGALVGTGIGGVVLGVILSIVAMVALVMLVGMDPPGQVYGTYGPAAADRDVPGAGACLADRPEIVDLTSGARTVPCTQRHGSEVIGTIELPSVGATPPTAGLRDYVTEACGLHLRAYVGSGPDETDLGFGAIVPDGRAWRDGDRTAWCLVASRGRDDGVGSVRDSGA